MDKGFKELGIDTKITILKKHDIKVRVIEEPPTFAGDDEDIVLNECFPGEEIIAV